MVEQCRVQLGHNPPSKISGKPGNPGTPEREITLEGSDVAMLLKFGVPKKKHKLQLLGVKIIFELHTLPM